MEKAMIHLERRPGYMDLLRRYRVYIDGIKVASIHESERLDFEVQPGQHEIVLKVDWVRSNTLTVNIKAGQDVFLFFSEFFKTMVNILLYDIWVEELSYTRSCLTNIRAEYNTRQ